MHETRLKGNFIGGIINYGYSVVGNKVVLNEEEAPIVRQIFTDYANGKSVVDIAKDLRARGIRNRGKIFQDHTIYVYYAGKNTPASTVLTESPITTFILASSHRRSLTP